jgi:hypothetical protein
MQQIDSVVPVPSARNTYRGLDDLQVGQSTTYPVGQYITLCDVIQYRSRRYNKKFTRRTEGDVVRVWRIS